MSKCEVDIAALIISWLEEQEWETYKEVQIFSYGRRADIVGVKGKLIWVVETKTTLTFEVIAQALGWKAEDGRGKEPISEDREAGSRN